MIYVLMDISLFTDYCLFSLFNFWLFLPVFLYLGSRWLDFCGFLILYRGVWFIWWYPDFIKGRGLLFFGLLILQRGGLLFQGDNWLLMLKLAPKCHSKTYGSKKRSKIMNQKHQKPLVSIIFYNVFCFDLVPFKAML